MQDFTDKIIAESIDYLVAHHQEQPDLTILAARAGYESAYFQKLFKARVGISPKRLVQYMNLRHARAFLEQGGTTLDAALASGLSGGSRLHDLFTACEAVTPGQARYKGAGMAVSYGFHPTPLGMMLVAVTSIGVCYVGFVVDNDHNVPVARMMSHFPLAAFTENSAHTHEAANHILAIWTGRADRGGKLRLDLHGTNLQIQVWQALLKIPCGALCTYKEIAVALGRPKAARAIGNAVGANPVSLLIPCHRVIRATGIIDNYGWGSPRKKYILAMEHQGAPPGTESL